jgi:hypothetical protein
LATGEFEALPWRVEEGLRSARKTPCIRTTKQPSKPDMRNFFSL